MKTIPSLNKKATVQKTATPANRSMNRKASVQTTATPANRSMNKSAKVSPKSYK
jgi:hypothetical protein